MIWKALFGALGLGSFLYILGGYGFGRLATDLSHLGWWAIPLAFARSSPAASARLEITTAISAGKSAGLAASISAAMFDPRPEIRMATRRFITAPDRDDRYRPRDARL